jgi:hypothetical protein
MFNLAATSLTMKSSGGRQWLVSATLVLFMLVQFASTVHAAEHAFHQEKSYCAALNNVENNKLLSHQLAGLQLTRVVIGYVATLLPQDFTATVFHSYHSRAPPQITV